MTEEEPMWGVLARFELAPGSEEFAERFFAEGRAIVEDEPPSTGWTAFRLGPTTYGALATFASEEDRAALLARGGPRSAREHADRFAVPPSFELVDVLQQRVPQA